MKFLGKLILFAALISSLVGWPMLSQAAVTYTVANITGPYSDGGNTKQVTGYMVLTGTYETGGFTFTPKKIGMSGVQQLVISGEDGFVFIWDAATAKVKAYQTATLTPTGSVASTLTMNSYTPAGTNASSALTIADHVPAGTNSAPALTMNSYTPAGTNSGPEFRVYHVADTTGLLPVYVSATSDKLYTIFGDSIDHTMTVSTPTFTGAAATLTGSVAAPTFTGTTSSLTGTAAAQTFTGTSSTLTGSVASVLTGTATTAAPLAEVGAGTSLSGVTRLEFLATGL